LLGIAFVSTFYANQQAQRTTVLALNIKAALVAVVYKKALQLNFYSRQEFDSSKVVSIVSTDCSRIEAFLIVFNVLWSAPLQICITVGFLMYTLGYSALAGIGILLLLGPIQNMIMGALRKVRREVAPITDSRVKKIQEVLLGIRAVKFFAWETPFVEQIKGFREKELNKVLTRGYIQAFVMVVAFSFPAFAGISAMIVYAVSNIKMDPALMFAGLAWFTQLRPQLFWLPQALAFYADFQIGMQRISGILAADQYHPLPTPDADMENGLEMEGASFFWETEKGVDQKLHLENITIKVPKGALVGIVGAVGSGKSTLLSSVIGETTLHSGSIKLGGKLGYAGQQPWILNATIRENILFGQPYHEDRYLGAIRDAALLTDLELFPDGDMTQIGERGINLSGGQKQRINLARLIYFECDIALLDDPLSAVDVHVGHYLFTHGIQGALQGRTRLLVTHQLHVLPQLDHIVVLNQGRIVEQGTFAELKANNGAFAQYLNTLDIDEESSSPTLLAEPSLAHVKSVVDKNINQSSRNLMQIEDRATGSVDIHVWIAHLKASGWWLYTAILFVLFFQFFRVLTDYWLVIWTQGQFGLTREQYIGLYIGIGFMQAITNLTLGLCFANGAITGARKIHETAFARILRAPLSYFDTTPLGRIMNRFAKDQDGVDNAVLDSIRRFVMNFANCLSIFGVILSATPLFSIPMFFILVLYYFTQKYYRNTSRELKRLESVSRSPLYAQIGETLAGLATIRAYGEQKRFLDKNMALIQTNQGPYYYLMSSSQWLSLRLEGFSAFTVFFAALLGVLARDASGFSAELLGLSLIYALQVTQSINFLVKLFAESEIAMNMVERLMYLGNELEQEAAPITDHRPPQNWPSKGSIEFDQVDCKYAPDLPLVLHDVSFTIHSQEKIGIVGRTGSGKSSMIQTLFRTIEICKGTIKIDGINIHSIGLKDLRTRLAIIPQDPVLFSGSVRDNLDPFQNYTDDDIWNCLERAALKEKVVEMGGLDGLVQTSGENISVGQRQLLCLARALLQKPVILVMDEATANVDYETDERIQQCLREDLKECTVLTIAHRINTIMDYDRIMVLDAGYIKEFDSPDNLMQIPNGIFRGMVNETSSDE
jgi:ABC-type multidrug transport system fused ATPase/permease subunit